MYLFAEVFSIMEGSQQVGEGRIISIVMEE